MRSIRTGVKRDRAEIVRFMETARDAVGARALGADRRRGRPRHLRDLSRPQTPRRRDWHMPAVAALPRPEVRTAGWEHYGGAMDAQMRNAIYGYGAESDKRPRPRTCARSSCPAWRTCSTARPTTSRGRTRSTARASRSAAITATRLNVGSVAFRLQPDVRCSGTFSCSPRRQRQRRLRRGLTAASLNGNGKYSPAAQSFARSAKWGLPGDPDWPGALVADRAIPVGEVEDLR